MKVKIKISHVVGFCTYSSICALNNKTLWSSDDFPYNFTANALVAAENECQRRGWVIVDDSVDNADDNEAQKLRAEYDV